MFKLLKKIRVLLASLEVDEVGRLTLTIDNDLILRAKGDVHIDGRNILLNCADPETGALFDSANAADQHVGSVAEQGTCCDSQLLDKEFSQV